jgi:hypothetical protein
MRDSLRDLNRLEIRNGSKHSFNLDIKLINRKKNK